MRAHRSTPPVARKLLPPTVRLARRSTRASLAGTLAASLVLAAPRARAQHGDGPLNQSDYALRATITGARTIEATARVRWTHQSDIPATALEWHLYGNAFAPGSLFLRTLSGGAHRGHPPGDAGSITVRSMTLSTGEDLLANSTHEFDDAPEDRTRLRTPLPAAHRRGATLEVLVRFSVTLPSAFSRSGCGERFCFAGQWFPKLAVYERDGRWSTFALHAQSEFYADFGRYELVVDAPRDALVFATGRRARPIESSAGRSTHTFILARAHDCAFGWSSRAQLRQSATSVRLARDGDDPGPPRAVSVLSIYTEPDAIVAARATRLVERALPALERRFGPYPYDTLTLVIAPRDAPGIGGMEYPSLITLDGHPLLPPFIRSLEYVAAHELAHQWFYGVVASDEHEHPLLDEGLTEFAAGLTLDELYGPRALGSLSTWGLGYWAMQGAFAALDEDDGPLVRSATAFAHFDSYAALVYRRASALFATVRDADPAAFDAALARYASSQRFRHPTPRDLLRAFEETPSLRDPSQRLLRPALELQSTVDLRVDHLEPSRAELSRHGALTPRVTVTVERPHGAIERRSWDTAEARHTIQGPIRSVRIDERPSLFVERARVNNARSTSGPGLLPFSARVANMIALLLRWLGP